MADVGIGIGEGSKLPEQPVGLLDIPGFRANGGLERDEQRVPPNRFIPSPDAFEGVVQPFTMEKGVQLLSLELQAVRVRTNGRVEASGEAPPLAVGPAKIGQQPMAVGPQRGARNHGFDARDGIVNAAFGDERRGKTLHDVGVCGREFERSGILLHAWKPRLEQGPRIAVRDQRIAGCKLGRLPKRRDSELALILPAVHQPLGLPQPKVAGSPPQRRIDFVQGQEQVRLVERLDGLLENGRGIAREMGKVIPDLRLPLGAGELAVPAVGTHSS